MTANNANTNKALKRGSAQTRIEDTIVWARGRMCRPCRAGDQVCPACVKAADAVELLTDLLATAVVIEAPAPAATPVVIPAPVEAPKPTKPQACDTCASGELLWDGEKCDSCGQDRADRKLKTAQRFWEAK